MESLGQRRLVATPIDKVNNSKDIGIRTSCSRSTAVGRENSQVKFDEKNRNLFDYFAVLGPRDDELQLLIKELLAGDNHLNLEEYD